MSTVTISFSFELHAHRFRAFKQFLVNVILLYLLLDCKTIYTHN